MAKGCIGPACKQWHPLYEIRRNYQGKIERSSVIRKNLGRCSGAGSHQGLLFAKLGVPCSSPEPIEEPKGKLDAAISG